VNNKNLFVGSLPWAVDDAKLSEVFSAFGTVVSAQIIKDRDTGRSKGFGFVEMSTEEEASAAIAKLNESEMEGRKIVVNVAKPRAN
jgi:RNA recognition motif-containing protein